MLAARIARTAAVVEAGVEVVGGTLEVGPVKVVCCSGEEQLALAQLAVAEAAARVVRSLYQGRPYRRDP